ncbi:MAG: hypothetical protein ACTSP1_08360 [Candidatus Freyarchaeota archaeon]
MSAAISGITAAVLLNLIPGIGQIGSSVAGLVIAVVVAVANPIANIPQDLYGKIIAVENINDAVDPEWGWRFYEYVHAPLTPPIDCLDKQTTHAWYYVTANNGIVCATPPFDKPIPVGETYAENFVAFYHYIAQNYGGYDTWLWIGGIPGGTPPT